MASDGSEEAGMQADSIVASRTSTTEEAIAPQAVTADGSEGHKGGGRDEDWHFLERPSTPATGGDTAAASAGQAAGRSQDSEHSFEHLSDHFGSPSGAASPIGSRTSLDNLSNGTSADDMLAGISAGRRRGAAAGRDVDPEVAATVQAAVDAVVAAAEQQQVAPSSAAVVANVKPAIGQDSEVLDSIPAVAQEAAAGADASRVGADAATAAEEAVVEDGGSAPLLPASPSFSFSTTPLGSSYADLAAAVDFEDGASPTDDAFEAEPAPQALTKEDADGGRSPGVETADDSSPDPVAPVVDDAAETKDSDDAASAGYLGMLRAALARVGQPAAAATVWAWLQEWVAPLRRLVPTRRLSSLAAGATAHLDALSRAALARLRAALAGAADLLALLDRSALVLGASGVGFAVLGALLYSSRSEIRRLRAQLVTKDQDLALLAAKIFKLNESIRAPARAIPIIHHASIAMFPAYPSLDIL